MAPNPFSSLCPKNASESSAQQEIASLEVPQRTLGLHVLHEAEVTSEAVTCDIVAVHGLGGDSYSTWTHQPSQQLWLQGLLPTSPYFKNARILTFGYDARKFIKPFKSSATGRVFTFGEELAEALRVNRTINGALNRPLIMIAHSLGGLVVKSALVYAQSRRFLHEDIYLSTKAIYFFATPHQGADIADWSNYLSQISKCVGVRATSVVKELQRWSKPLLDLSTLFSEQIPELIIVTFFEKLPLAGVIVGHQMDTREHIGTMLIVKEGRQRRFGQNVTEE